MKIFIVFGFLFTLVSCDKSSTDALPEDTVSAIDTPVISSVQYNNGQGFFLNGNKLLKLNSAKIERNGQTEDLQIQEVSSSQVVLKFIGNKTLAKGMWSLVVKNAYGQTASSVYLDVQDNSITDSKIVSIGANKIIGMLAASIIPNLSASYATVVSGKVPSSLIPDLSGVYSSLGHTHTNSDITSLAASKLTGIVSLAQVPNLSASYAALSAGKIGLSVIPDLSVSYSVLGHVHAASDVGAVGESLGAGDADKVVKLNGSGLVDRSMLPGPAVPALLYGNDQLYGRLISGFPCFGFDCNSTDNTTVVLPDGAHYITQNESFGYAGYIKNFMSESITNYSFGGLTPRNYPGVCLYGNTTCSGNCGYQNKPIKNALLQRYNSSAQIEWMKASGSDSSFTFDIVNDMSFRNPSGSCTVIDSNETNTAVTAFYQFSTGYSLPVSAIPTTGLYIGIK